MLLQWIFVVVVVVVVNFVTFYFCSLKKITGIMRWKNGSVRYALKLISMIFYT